MYNLKRGRIVFRAALLLIILVLGLSIPINSVCAMANPSAGYCEALGYQYTDTVAADGAMTGYCILPNNQTVDAWEFLQGKEAQKYSYCKKHGFDIRTVNDPEICKIFLTDCAVCVLQNGSTIEVTKLMNLDFREKICSNGKCCDPATMTDCSLGTGFPLIYWIAILAIIIITVAGLIYLKFRKRHVGGS